MCEVEYNGKVEKFLHTDDGLSLCRRLVARGFVGRIKVGRRKWRVIATHEDYLTAAREMQTRF